jgi:hypothetical protein
MVSLTANDSMVALLNQAKGLTEICDPKGKVIGFFAPISLEHAQDYVVGAAHFDRAEIQRRKEQNLPGRTTKEVFEHLLSLTKEERLRSYLQEKIKDLAERDGCATP